VLPLVLSGAGKCSIFLGANEPVTFEGHLIRVRLNAELASPDFYYYYFSSPTGRQAIESIVEQVAAAGIRGSDLAKLSVPYPPLRDQQAIAAVLRTIDEKIELNRRMNETLEAIAQALFKSWFVDFDPVRAKADGRQPAGMDAATAALFPDTFEDSPMGEIPWGWQVGCLADVCDIVMGQSPPGQSYNEAGDGLPFYQGTRDFGWRFPSRRVYCTAPTRIAAQADVLLSVRAPVGSINVAGEQCAIGRGVAALRPERQCWGFVYYLLRATQDGWHKFEAEGTVFGSASKTDVHRFQALVPEIELRTRFSELVAPIDDMIRTLDEQSSTLAALRDALLPKLLSGELRVRDVEQSVQECLV
jgi:type I restriction enzyme, S subunit